MVIKYEAGTLNSTPTCDIELLKNKIAYGAVPLLLRVKSRD